MNLMCEVFLFIASATSIIYGQIIKCCESNHSFSEVNGTFKCSDYPSNQSHIFTSTTNFLENNTDGQCVEFFKDFYIFNISKSGISQFQIVDEKKVRSKCCPLNFVYNTFTHGCEEVENANYPNIKENFLKVGLSRCDVIVDEIVENITEEFNDSSCVDRTTNGSFILRTCKESIDVCSEMRCVQKCCPDGYTFWSNLYSTCIEGYQGINLTALSIRGASEFPEDPFVTVIANKFFDRYFINDSLVPSYLNRKRIFSYINIESRNITTSNYCVEYLKALDGYFFIYLDKVIIQYYPYVLPISVILLALTIVIYFLLNEVEKMFGKILVNYCLALLIWNGQLAYAHLVGVNRCLETAFGVIFSRFTKSIWSNFLCWNIWRTFGSMTRINNTERRKKQYKTIRLYILCGWGTPAALTLIIFLLYTYKEMLPYVIQPQIAVQFCDFESPQGNYSRLIFMNIPIMLMQAANIVLFVKTTMYFLKVKKEINKMDDNTDKMEQFKRNRAKLYLVLKLLIITGLAFITDAMVFGPIPPDGPGRNVAHVFNIINASQGILIFIVCICNRQIYKKVKKKLGISNVGSSTSIDSATTQSSTVSGQSSNINCNQNYTTSTIYQLASIKFLPVTRYHLQFHLLKLKFHFHMFRENKFSRHPY